MMATDEDRQLLERVVARDRRAFEALYHRYYPRLFRYLYRITRRPEMVEELVSDVLLVVWQSAQRFDGRSRVSTWVLGIAYRRALKVLSRDEVRRRRAQELEPPSATCEGPELLLARREAASRLGRALAELTADQRAVVELTFFDGLAYREIAEIVGCPVNTVKTRMFHAKRRLRALLPDLEALEGAGAREENEA